VALHHLGFVELPEHAKAGGFDHAAVHEPSGRVYVAHTANDAVDIIDADARRHVGSIPGLTAVAGALVAEPDWVFTSNRGENTVGVFTVTAAPRIEKVAVGIRPNGVAYDPRRARMLVAHVGDPAIPGSCTVSIVDVHARKRIADLPVAGRTRWTVYDPVADAFHVNIADPPQIIVVEFDDPLRIRRTMSVPHGGPHGLDLDVARRRLFCACDAGVLLEVDADTGTILATEAIAGVPDVIFFNPTRGRVYVAIGEPGVIEVFDTSPLRRHETIVTERSAHTLAFDFTRQLVWAFLPASHRAAVYVDRP
jgi:DNA-binding beta-propeller fold protein YncE